MSQKVITILGGTGFIGRYVVKRLAAAGYAVRVISRHPNAGLHLKTAGAVGQVVLMSGNLARPEALASKIAGSYAVINLVGVMFESGKQNFTQIHARGAEKLAQIAAAEDVKYFIHVSALGVDKATGSHYARTKLLGEKAVLAAFPEATILRPSVIFGPEDHFFNQFAAMASLLPALPLIGGGRTRFQPVYAGDVARAIEMCLLRPETRGKTFELGGPHSFSFQEMLLYVQRQLGRKRRMVSIPFGLAPLMASVLQFLPYPLRLTPDQVKLLKTDNVVSPGALTLANLGIHSTAVEMIVPGYLARFNKKTAGHAALERISP